MKNVLSRDRHCCSDMLSSLEQATAPHVKEEFTCAGRVYMLQSSASKAGSIWVREMCRKKTAGEN